MSPPPEIWPLVEVIRMYDRGALGRKVVWMVQGIELAEGLVVGGW